MVIVLQILYVIVCVILIAVVLFQSGKEAGLTGVVNGASDTFFGKNRGRTIDAMLDKWTSVGAVLFILLALSIVLLSK